MAQPRLVQGVAHAAKTAAKAEGTPRQAPTSSGIFGNTSDLVLELEWLADYYAKRKPVAVLQAEINDFMADYDAREEKAGQDKISAAEEEGWTVVVGSKGRKKTMDAESGITVGAISSAAVAGKAKRSKKEIVMDFYRFQRREAKRNEVLELQQKFAEDKVRIAKMREARKFRPY